MSRLAQQKRKRSPLARAYEQTYRRSIIDTDEYRLSTIIFGFLGGEELKAKINIQDPDYVDWQHDRSLWNKIESSIFLLPRLIKNIIKLFTEFIWNAAAELLLAASERARPAENRFFSFFMTRVANLIQGLSYIPRLVALIGQTLTSPLNAVKDTYNAIVPEESNSKNLKILGGIAAFVRGLFSLTLYATIGTLALPMIAPVFGATVASLISTALTMIANLPVMGTAVTLIGTGFTLAISSLASLVGLSIPAAITATSTLVAGTTMLAIPAIIALRIGLHKLLPFTTVRTHHVQVPQVDDLDSCGESSDPVVLAVEKLVPCYKSSPSNAGSRLFAPQVVTTPTANGITADQQHAHTVTIKHD